MKNLNVQITHPQFQKMAISLEGKLTSADAVRFKSKVLNLMTASRPAECTIDISGLSQMDLTGVNALAMAHRNCQALGSTLYILSSDDKPAEEFLHLTKFRSILNFRSA